MKLLRILKVAGLLGLIASFKAMALPASARLFQQVYGYRTSCLLCHTNGGGSAVNSYGKVFLRNGANSGAFKKIENVDSDKDGILNGAEIIAKANPGDKKSTPSALGDWLANTGAIFIPQKELERLFPGFEKFSVIEGSLNAQQLEFLKSKLGRTPPDDDKVPTFYFAEKDGKRVAVGQLVAEQSKGGKSLNTGVAVATSGKILRVEVLGGSEAKALEKNQAILDSYKDKSAANLPTAQESEESSLLRSTIERSVYLMQAVFGGAK